MSVLRRLAPAILLVALAPIVAEFLLGDFSIREIAIVIALLPLYGGGALLIREVARRGGRGWPAILLLGFAYALLEEGFLTQSLFNPDYVGLRLLDYGYIPSLGTSLNWCMHVLSIHVVWSVATPILIAEGFAGERRTQPWLRIPGLVVTTLLFLLGCVTTSAFSLKASPFVATAAQFSAVGALAVLAILAAFVTRRAGNASGPTRAVPRTPVVFVASFALALAFTFADQRGYAGIPPVAGLLARVALEGAAAMALVRWSGARDWGPVHYLAVASGTTLTYAIFGTMTFLRGHTHLGKPTNAVDVAGQLVLTALVFLAIWQGARRSRP